MARFLTQASVMVMLSCCAMKRSLTDMMDQLSGGETVLDRITDCGDIEQLQSAVLETPRAH
jgi:hypothetical protein